jgi:hypothetical protein
MNKEVVLKEEYDLLFETSRKIYNEMNEEIKELNELILDLTNTLLSMKE